jgi:serine/threonine-protein kinase
MVPFACGQHVGDFTLVRLLARGGLSRIWLARRDDQFVAIKMFCRDHGWSDDESAECRRYFANEAQWLMKLRHPNLVRGLGSIEGQDVPMIALEFIEGQSLRDWLDANATPRPLAEFHKLARGVTAAVKYIHEQGLMHRDVKPSNVMVTSEFETRLIDLEFVRAIPLASEQLDRPMSGEIGAWAFAAPELMDGLDNRYDERVDVYSLGALLIELLVGRPPRRLPPAACRSDVPHALSDLLWAMVDERPTNRPGWVDITPVLLP